MSTGNGHFNLLARVLHWSMALMIIAMLFIGVTMVASLHLRPMLIDLHRPLGIAIGVLVLLRLYNRLRHRPPPLPADLPVWQVMAAKASHWMLYALMLAMPLIGWAMLSAGGYPIVLWGGLHLPPIVPHTPALYAALRNAHSLLAYVLFATVLMHVGAALFQQLLGGQLVQRVQLVQQHRLQALGHLRRVAVGAAGRLAHDLVDQAQALQARGGQAQLFGGILGLAGILPQDRGAAFRGNGRVHRVLQHHGAVAHAQRQRAAGATFTDHGADDRHLQFGHLDQVACDRFGLAARFGVDARPGAGGVDQGQHRQAEALGHLHQAQGLAVAFRLGHAEVAAHLLPGVAALLVADDHQRAAVDPGQSTDDGLVVAEGAVAGQFVELVAELAHVVQGVGPGRVPGQLGDLPGAEVAEDLGGALAQLVLQRAHFGVHVDRRAGAGAAQFLDLGLQVGDGLLEIEVVRVHPEAGQAGKCMKQGSVAERTRRDRTVRYGVAQSRTSGFSGPRAGRWRAGPRAPRAGRARHRAGAGPPVPKRRR